MSCICTYTYIYIHICQCHVFTVLSLPSYSGPPIQIIPDYRAREEGDSDIDKSSEQQLQLEEEGEEGDEEDRAFAAVIEDAGIGDSISTY